MKKHIRGVSLVELMVSLALGALVLLTTITAVTDLLKGRHLATAKVENELSSVALFFERDIQRAGYWGDAAAALNAGLPAYANPFSVIDTATPGCVRYSYDRDSDGSVTTDVGADERFAIALHAGVLYLRQGGDAYDCNVLAGQWEALTGPVNVKVTTFAVTVSSATTPIKTTTRKLATRTVTYTLTGAPTAAPTEKLTLKTTLKVPNDVVL